MENLWQEESNSWWLTDVMPTCSICGKKAQKVLEFKTVEDDKITRCCFLAKKAECMRKALRKVFLTTSEEFVYSRGIEFQDLGHSDQVKKREPVGLSKRFLVMQRDGFQCVLCGASGKDSRLEVDHKRPVASGGNGEMDNLQTLCFDCNRGKGAKHG